MKVRRIVKNSSMIVNIIGPNQTEILKLDSLLFHISYIECIMQRFKKFASSASSFYLIATTKKLLLRPRTLLNVTDIEQN